MSRRTLVIGDIHGCWKSLKLLLEYVRVQPGDQVITLGDYVDRGPQSREVIDWLLRRETEGELVPLLGNHEIMMLAAWEEVSGGQPTGRMRHGDFGGWLQVGGDATLRSYSGDQDDFTFDQVPAQHLDFLQHRLQPFFETDTHLFVHASLIPDMPLAEQPDSMLYWESWNHGGPPGAHESGKIMVCGHSAQRTGLPWNAGHAICIDTYVYGRGGWLTCLEPTTGQYWQANQLGDIRTDHLEPL